MSEPAVTIPARQGRTARVSLGRLMNVPWAPDGALRFEPPLSRAEVCYRII